MVDLEEEEYQGGEELDFVQVKPILWLLTYIPPWKGKTNMTKDPDCRKFTVSTPLLPKQVEFEGTTLAHIPMLKMEDWDLADHERFPHLVTNKYMTKCYYEETGVTLLEPMKWVRGVGQAGLLHMLCMPHFHRSTVNTVCACQLITLVHNGCLWLGEPISITDMLIH